MVLNVMVRRLIWLGALFSLGLIASVGATPRDDMKAAMERCNVFEDEKTYLDCIYGAAQPVRAELGLPPAPQSQTRLVPSASVGIPARPSASRTEPRQQFLSGLLGSGKIQAQSPMAAYSFDANGYFTVMLRNGQVWKQLEGRLAKWREPAPKYNVTIRSGALNSSNLEVEGEAGVFKVKRIR
jgi:hypothetical protein